MSLQHPTLSDVKHYQSRLNTEIASMLSDIRDSFHAGEYLAATESLEMLAHHIRNQHGVLVHMCTAVNRANQAV